MVQHASRLVDESCWVVEVLTWMLFKPNWMDHLLRWLLQHVELAGWRWLALWLEQPSTDMSERGHGKSDKCVGGRGGGT